MAFLVLNPVFPTPATVGLTAFIGAMAFKTFLALAFNSPFLLRFSILPENLSLMIPFSISVPHIHG